MIVNGSTKRATELDEVIEDLKAFYKDAIRQNEISPRFIRNPLAWALYQVWKKYDGR